VTATAMGIHRCCIDQPHLSVDRRPGHLDIDGDQNKVGRAGVIFIRLDPWRARRSTSLVRGLRR
jgi:hypothetical protein